MTKITLGTVGSITNNPITAANTINNNSTTLVTAFDNTLSRDGTAPNAMSSNIDMNSFRILNLPEALTADEPLRLQDLSTFTGGGTVTNIPAGGTTGQFLGKTSNTDYAVSWQNESSDLTAGTNITITGTTPATISTVASPTFTGANISGLTASLPVYTDASKNLTTNTVTGTGSVVQATSPTLVTPNIGTPSAGVLTSCTGLPIITGVSGLATGVSAFLATPSSANLITACTDETGTGSLVFATSPTLVTPLLGTPTSGTLTNCTGLPIAGITGLGTGVGTALAAAVTGSSGIVLTTSPNITTPNIIGTATNNNASAGSVGEYSSSNIASGSGISLTTGTSANVTSLSLTAGDWMVTGNVSFIAGGATNVTFLISGLSLTTATLPANTDASLYGQQYFGASGLVFSNNITYSIAPIALRFSLSTTTTIFLVAQSSFTVSTIKAFGFLQAERRR